MNMIIQKVKKHKEFLTACFVVFWVSIGFFLFQNVYFETNDDNSMARMAYGMLGEYETHLVFINVFVGQCLKLFLTIIPGLPWYTLFQCGLICLSFFAIIYLVFKRFGVKGGLLPVVILLVFFSEEFFLKIQFSKTAGICTLAGVLMLFHAVKTGGGKLRWKWILAAILTLAGSMYRFNVFGMVLIPLFGYGVSMVWQPLMQKNWKEILRICVPFVVVFGACFLFRVYDYYTYQASPEWAAYKEFNSLRAQLMDYGFPDYDENIELYQSLDISESDLKLYKGWDFADSEKFTTEVLRQLVDAKEDPVFSKTEYIDALRNFFKGYDYSPTIILALCIAIVTCGSGNTILLIYQLGAIVFVQTYLFLNGRYGLNRIDVTLACTLYIAMVLYVWGTIKSPGKLLCGLLSCVMVVSPFLKINFEEGGLGKTEYEPVLFYELIEADQNNLYVRNVLTSVTRVPRALEIYPVGYQSNSCSLGGWGTYTVPYLTMWENYGIQNLYRDMVDNPNVYFVSTKSTDAYIRYIQDHYAPEAEAYLVKITEDEYPIYRISTTSGPDLDVSQAVFSNSDDNLRYALSAEEREDGTICLYGYMYFNNNNSFVSNIYLSLTGEDGDEKIYYTTQTYMEAIGDLMNGAYGNYTITLPVDDGSSFIKVYLECGDDLYCVHIGTVEQILPEAFGNG